jgi:predicted 3-demethylubiquinone-9 3-methyltransferase (glyoxalase superfamily)
MLWFDDDAERAATFYTSTFRTVVSTRSSAHVGYAEQQEGRRHHGSSSPSTARMFVGLNGGPDFKFNEAVSFVIDCKDQAVGRSLLGRPDQGRRRAERVWLAGRTVRPLVAGHARRLLEMTESDDRPAADGR